MKKVEIETAKFENVQVGTVTETKWETSDGQQFGDERSAEHHEFYRIKVKQRGIDIPVENVFIFDFTCKEDLERYENYYYSRDHIKYDKDNVVFPNTFVFYEVSDPDWEPSDLGEDYNHYDQPDMHIHLATLEDYKKLLIDAVSKIV